MTARVESRCSFCKMSEDIKELIYELIVRQGVKPLPAYNEICEVLKSQGLTPPGPPSFYTHCKKHLDPERSALMTIAKGEDRLNENAHGFDATLLDYLMRRWAEETSNRKALYKLIKKIDDMMDRKDKEALGAGDLAKVGTALANAVKVLQEGHLTMLVQDKVINDLLLGIVNKVETEVVKGLRRAADILAIKTKNGDVIRQTLEDEMHKIIKESEGIYNLANQQLVALREYKK